MPGVRVALNAPKPKASQKPPETIGEHLRARRLALGRYQRDVAAELGVDAFTLLNWEKNRTRPAVSAYPAILAFLGYDPFPPPQTIGERLRAARRAKGWTIDQGAAALGVDPATVGDWERGGTILYRKHRKLIAGFLGIEEETLAEDMAHAWGLAHSKGTGGSVASEE